MLEFKLKYYFNLYKDTVLISATKFKDIFIRKHGKFELLNELVIMIQKYQYDKYGNLLQTGRSLNRIVKKGTYNNMEQARIRSRFGTKEERIRRKLKEVYDGR